MGKGAPEQTTTYERQPIPGSEWGYQQALNYWNAMMSGQGPTYPGPLMTPQETGILGGYGGALESLLGMPGLFGGGTTAPGGTFGQGQEAIGRFLSPEFLNVSEDPYVQSALGNVLADTRRRMAGAGLGYGTSLGDAEMRAAADLLLGESGRRQALQAGLGQFATELPLSAMTNFMPMAGLPFARNYGEWMRQMEQQTQGAQMLGGLGMGGAGQPFPTTSTSDPGKGWLGDMLGWYSMINPGWLPWMGSAGGAGPSLQNKYI